MYRFGKGIAQNYQKAIKWYRLAALSGSVSAQNNLGNLYKNGQGTKPSFSEAFKWYKMAYDRGEVSSAYNIAQMYYSGKGLKKPDFENAIVWFRKAAEKKQYCIAEISG